MNKETKAQIESFAWNCTVGAGVDPEEVSNEPDEDVLRALKFFLGRRPTSDEVEYLTRSYQRCLQEIVQP